MDFPKGKKTLASDPVCQFALTQLARTRALFPRLRQRVAQRLGHAKNRHHERHLRPRAPFDAEGRGGEDGDAAEVNLLRRVKLVLGPKSERGRRGILSPPRYPTLMTRTDAQFVNR